jgi:hypothetical protein
MGTGVELLILRLLLGLLGCVDEVGIFMFELFWKSIEEAVDDVEALIMRLLSRLLEVSVGGVKVSMSGYRLGCC